MPIIHTLSLDKMFKIPTATQFNSWTLSEKALLVNSECVGHIRPGITGFLVYENEDCFIEYSRDNKGHLKTAEAITMKEGMQRLLMFAMAQNIMNNQN